MKNKPKNLVWILGQGGLLGTSLTHRINTHSCHFSLWMPGKMRFAWDSPSLLQQQFEQSIQLFQEASIKAEESTLIWAAGSGIIGTNLTKLISETEVFVQFLNTLSAYYKEYRKPSTFFLASSAGGVWGGNQDFPITEDTPVNPISEYGRQKLAQEDYLLKFSESFPNLKVLIGRISNLYGSAQKLQKPQGLLSQLCRSSLLRSTMDIFVPLETIRDYIDSEDCAELIFRSLIQFQTSNTLPKTLIKIFASEEPNSIFQILHWLRQLTPQSPLLVFPQRSISNQQPKELSFRSKVLVESFSCKTLQEGLKQLLDSQESQLQSGNLPYPEFG